MTGTLTFYKNKDCRGDVVVKLNDSTAVLRAEADGAFPDDAASSLKLENVKKHTYIAVYDNQHGHINDDWTEIFVLKDIVGEYCIPSFEQTHMDENIVMYYYPHDGLDGDVSRIEVDYRETPHGQLIFFSKHGCQGRALMAFRDTPDKVYKKGDAGFKNNKAKSLRLLSVPAGTVIRLYDHWNASKWDDWTEIKVLKHITTYDIPTFERNIKDDTVEVVFHQHNGLDGDVSHITVGMT